jgi:hypothetical protein
MVCVPTQDDPAILGDFAEPLYAWDEVLQEYAEASTAERGLGYWVEVMPGEGGMHSEGSDAPAGNYETQQLTYTTDPMRAPGRHLLGNPFNKPIYWENIYVSTSPGSFSLRVSDPAASSLIHNVYYAAYDNDEQAYRYYDPDDYQERDGKIFPWEGFWVLVKQPVYLMIPWSQDPPSTSLDPGPYPMVPRETSSVSAAVTGKGPTYDRPRASGSARPQATGTGWRLKISAVSGALRDEYNYVGIHPRGRDDYDRLDIPDAGSMSASPRLQLYLPHDDWGPVSDRYCVDMHGSGEGGWSPAPAPWIRQPRARTDTPDAAWPHRWDLVIDAVDLADPVTVRWKQVPPGWELTLVDVATNRTVEMRRERHYTYHPAEESESRNFVVFARRVD